MALVFGNRPVVNVHPSIVHAIANGAMVGQNHAGNGIFPVKHPANSIVVSKPKPPAGSWGSTVTPAPVAPPSGPWNGRPADTGATTGTVAPERPLGMGGGVDANGNKVLVDPGRGPGNPVGPAFTPPTPAAAVPVPEYMKPYMQNEGFKSWWANHPYAWNDPNPAHALAAYGNESWKTAHPDFQNWLNTQSNLALLGQGFGDQQGAYNTAHPATPTANTTDYSAFLTDPRYLQTLSNSMWGTDQATSGLAAQLAGILTPGANGLTPWRTSMNQAAYDRNMGNGNLASSLASRGLFGGGGALDQGYASNGASYANASQLANNMYGPGHALDLQSQIIGAMRGMNPEIVAALQQSYASKLGGLGVQNPGVTVPTYTQLMNQAGAV